MVAVRLNAQLMIEQGPSASTRDGGIYIYGLTGKENKLRYEKINGSPFLDEAWKNATLYDSKGNTFGKFRVRLNLATHEVHYLDKSGIENSDNVQIARVELDSSYISKGEGRVFSSDEEVIRSKFKGQVKFAVHLNDGYYTLMRVTVREVSKSDSLFSTMNRYFFKDKNFYFLKSGRQTVYLKRLSFQELRRCISAEKWPLQRNDFSGNPVSQEEEVLGLLNLINKGLSRND
ncbi:MAG: hypothetical protein RL766_689 [Bacteroidota bacterium]